MQIPGDVTASRFKAEYMQGKMAKGWKVKEAECKIPTVPFPEWLHCPNKDV